MIAEGRYSCKYQSKAGVVMGETFLFREARLSEYWPPVLPRAV